MIDCKPDWCAKNSKHCAHWPVSKLFSSHASTILHLSPHFDRLWSMPVNCLIHFFIFSESAALSSVYLMHFEYKVFLGKYKIREVELSFHSVPLFHSAMLMRVCPCRSRFRMSMKASKGCWKLMKRELLWAFDKATVSNIFCWCSWSWLSYGDV